MVAVIVGVLPNPQNVPVDPLDVLVELDSVALATVDVRCLRLQTVKISILLGILLDGLLGEGGQLTDLF